MKKGVNAMLCWLELSGLTIGHYSLISAWPGAFFRAGEFWDNTHILLLVIKYLV